MARAKHTVRSEARRRYRQASTQPEEDTAEALEEESPANARPGPRPSTPARPNQTPSGRPGFLSSFRGAYHPARIREDIPHFPKLLQSRAFLAALALTIAGAIGGLAFRNYTGGLFAFELLLLPGSALAPQLVAGFFAPRASYFLGLVIGLIQGVLYMIVVAQASTAGAALTSDQTVALAAQSLLTGPLSGMLFASAAAWYRRFLSLSSPKRAQAGRGASGGRGPSGKGPAKPAASRRAGR